MNILYYHQHFSTPKGATGTRSYEFAQKLIKRGHVVTIVCGSYWIAETGLTGVFVRGQRTGTVDGIKVVEFELEYSNSDSFLWRTFIFLRFSWQGIKIVLKENYDILFATSTPLTAGIPGIFAKLLRGKPFIFEVRDLWPELPKAMGVITNPFILKLMDFLETILYKSATACIGLSPGIVDGIKKKTPNKKLVMIPNGCDLNLVYNVAKNKKHKKFIAVFTGAHGFANGLDAVLDAAKILIQNGEIDIEIQFIGDGVLKPKLIKRVELENIKNCKFIDPMPKDDLFTYLQKEANVGLMILDNIPAFYYGTSPNKFFDYIALGLPVINNYPGWLAEMIIDNNCGLAVTPRNPEAFSEALITMKNDRESLFRMGENAKQLASSKFDRNKLSDQFVDFLVTNINR
jgi:glycosyltransferase involved in cell wall biosynthesis